MPFHARGVPSSKTLVGTIRYAVVSYFCCNCDTLERRQLDASAVSDPFARERLSKAINNGNIHVISLLMESGWLSKFVRRRLYSHAKVTFFEGLYITFAI